MECFSYKLICMQLDCLISFLSMNRDVPTLQNMAQPEICIRQTKQRLFIYNTPSTNMHLHLDATENLVYWASYSSSSTKLVSSDSHFSAS